jgi:hypothetical protein
MGKRSDFEREALDFYPTPMSAVLPLLPYLPFAARFCEPCAGAGDLIRHLEAHGHRCTSAYDVEPGADNIERHDASFLVQEDLKGAEMVITNPPWDRAPLHQIIERCSRLTKTWLLFDADWMHTKQAQPYMKYCAKIISVGRVKWIEDSAGAGKDNCCWYLFVDHPVATVFHTR